MGAIHYGIGWLNHLILLQPYQGKDNFCQMNADYYSGDWNLLEEIIQQEHLGTFMQKVE